MKSLREPLERLERSIDWWLEVPECRLLYVRMSSSLRVAVCERLAAIEFDARALLPVFVVETGYETHDAGWGLRIAELEEDYEALRAAVEEDTESADLPPLAPPSADRAPSLEAFAERLEAVLACVAAREIPGIVLVLAPLAVETPPSWQNAVRALLERRSLRRVRFAVLDHEDAATESLALGLGQATECVDCVIDPAAAQADTQQMVSAMAAQQDPSARGAGPLHAWAPARKNKLKAVDEVETAVAVAEANVAPSLADPSFGLALRTAILRAATAMKDGDAAAAIQYQRTALVLCSDAEAHAQAVTCEAMLGGYELQAGLHTQAIASFRGAALRATRVGLMAQAAQAKLGEAAAMLHLGGEPRSVAGIYAEAGHYAEQASVPALAVEAFRMCGQLALRDGDESNAVTALVRAIRNASTDEPTGTPSAPLAARMLADAYRRWGQSAQADSLEEEARRREGTDGGVS